MDGETFLNIILWIGGALLIGAGTNWQTGLGALFLAIFVKVKED